MPKILKKETQPFNIDIPYELIEVGSFGKKPLFIYLHGYKQNIAIFKKRVKSLLATEAYHLFLQGPYIVYDEKHQRKVSEWGRAWYLYDGRQKQFRSSLEKSAGYIQAVLDSVQSDIESNNTMLLGYSMGGYLAGYFALSRPKYIEDLVVIGGRIKTEYFSKKTYPDLNVLALHGAKDRSVNIQTVKKSAKELENMGANVSFYQLEEGHRLSVPYITKVKEWLRNNDKIVATK